MNAPARPVETVTPYRFTYEDVLRMVEVGILAEDARVELIEGELLEVSAESVPHVRCRRWLTQFFMRRLAEGEWEVNPDAPAVLEATSAPEPDIAIFPSAVHDRDVTGRDIVLAIEVSLSSLAFDLGRKGALYARHGVQEYWVVDVVGRRIVVHRQPTLDGYGDHAVVDQAGEIAPLAFPALVVRVADLPLED
ncbi:Uma2 family endonuclease [soil metagenome]